MSWAAEEFGGIDLGDKRLDRRAVLLAERLAAKSAESIPTACNGWAETQAAYRFLSNERVDWEAILEPHAACTLERIAPHPTVLCIQDTTELNFNGQSIEGMGPLSYEAQRGMYLHPTYVVTPAREPLGLIDSWSWARKAKGPDGQRHDLPESTRWIEGYERVAEAAAEVPGTRLVYVADREADIVALMARARDLSTPADYLLRAKHDRKLPGGEKLWTRLAASEVLGGITFVLPARRGRKARRVCQELHATTVSISDGHGGTVQTNALLATEINVPPGEKAVVWRLLTSCPIGDLGAAIELIEWYRARWEIEQFFDVLKNGCRVEELQLSTIERVTSALALYMVIAWRINRLMRLGRQCPELEAGLVFAPEEWKAAYVLTERAVPEEEPTLNEVLRLIAQLGGFLGRKGDGEPGVKTIWKGMQQVQSFCAGLRYAREHPELFS